MGNSTTQVQRAFHFTNFRTAIVSLLLITLLFLQKQSAAQGTLSITVTNTSPTGCQGGTCNGSVNFQSSGGFTTYSTLNQPSDISTITTDMTVDPSGTAFTFTGIDASDPFNNHVVTNQLFVDNGYLVLEGDFQVDENGAGYFGLAPTSPFYPSQTDYLYSFFYHNGLIDYSQPDGNTGPISNPASPDGHFHISSGIWYHLKIQKVGASVTYTITGSDNSTGTATSVASPISGQFKIASSVYTGFSFTTKAWNLNFNPPTTALCPGSYTYTVLNASGASLSKSITLSGGGGLTAGDITMFPSSTVPGQASQTIFLGYGLQAVLLYAGAVNGTGPFTYTWSPTSSLISYAGYALVFPTKTTTYSLTIKNAAGCSVTKTFTVYVLDVRCGTNKVSVCHTTKGKSSTQCVNYDDVDSHLSKGDKLGSCGSTASRMDESASEEVELVNALTVKAMPNPSTAYFNILLNSNTNDKISLRVFDGLGRLVEVKEGLKPGSSLSIGSNYQKGLYIVEIRQGAQVQTTKLIKQ